MFTLPCRHDSTKRAVCPRWLHGTCPLGTACPLQHQRKPELMPICMHFLKVGGLVGSPRACPTVIKDVYGIRARV